MVERFRKPRTCRRGSGEQCSGGGYDENPATLEIVGTPSQGKNYWLAQCRDHGQPVWVKRAGTTLSTINPSEAIHIVMWVVHGTAYRGGRLHDHAAHEETFTDWLAEHPQSVVLGWMENCVLLVTGSSRSSRRWPTMPDWPTGHSLQFRLLASGSDSNAIHANTPGRKSRSPLCVSLPRRQVPHPSSRFSFRKNNSCISSISGCPGG